MQKEALQQANGNSIDDQLLLQTGYVEKVNSAGKGKILEIRFAMGFAAEQIKVKGFWS